MKIKSHVWKEPYIHVCDVCGKRAYRTLYNDRSVGMTKRGWFACYRTLCSIWIKFQLLNDEGSPNEIPS